jgi:hypothetical protein
VSFGESGVELEEGFITFIASRRPTHEGRQDAGGVRQMNSLPTTSCRGPIGHRLNNLVGGEDGIDDAGISAR